MAPDPPSLLERWSLPILVALALVAYAPVLGLSFFGDDFHVLYRLGADRDLGTGSFFRPLPDWTHALTWRLGFAEPWAFRVVNVALLGLNGWLVVQLTRSLLGKALPGGQAPWIAGALFVLYPHHLEPQLWIVGRGSAMATTFILAALVIARSAAAPRWRIIGVAISGTLGGLCYESALLLALLLAVLRPATPGAERPFLKRLVAVAAATAALNLAIRLFFTGGVANEYGAAFFMRPWHHYPASAAKAAVRLCLPPAADEGALPVLAVALGIGLLAAASLIAHGLRARPALRGPVRSLLALLAIAMIIPAVAGVSTRTCESDRFLYLPSAFLCVLLAIAVSLVRPGRMRLLAASALLSICCILLWRGFRPWFSASSTVHRVLLDLQGASAPGTTYVVGLPGDIKGAYVFRRGFEAALLMNGLDTARIQRRGPVLEVRNGHEEARCDLVDQADGSLLLTDTDTTFLRPADAAWAWRAWQFEQVWP